MFHTADPDDILNGKITDVYFDRSLRILKAKGVNPVVKAEFIAKSFPDNWPWAIFAGLEEILYLLQNLPVAVRAMREGTVYNTFEPVLEIDGHDLDLCLHGADQANQGVRQGHDP